MKRDELIRTVGTCKYFYQTERSADKLVDIILSTLTKDFEVTEECTTHHFEEDDTYISPVCSKCGNSGTITKQATIDEVIGWAKELLIASDAAATLKFIGRLPSGSRLRVKKVS